MDAVDEWQEEMNRMLGTLQHESEGSLRKINRRFEVLKLPFDAEFKAHFLKQSTQRLESSFSKIEMERWSNDQAKNSERKRESHNAKNTSACDTSAGGRGMSMNTVTVKSGNRINAVENGDIIEIIDSSDGDEDDVHIRSEEANRSENAKTAQKHVNNTANHNENSKTNSIDGGDARPKLKLTIDRAPRQNGEDLTKNSHLSNGSKVVEVDNVQGKPDESGKCETTPRNDRLATQVKLGVSPLGDQPSVVNGNSKQQTLKSSPNTHPEKSLQNAVGSASQPKRGLKCHKRINGKWIEIEKDSHGLFHCTYCIRQFRNLHDLSLHLKKSHKNDQYLHHCTHCLHQFAHKVEKDRHEGQCKGHHFECHLCKVYVTKSESNMQVHMRMHSGVKPFPCPVCKKSFQTKSFLKYHLNFIHNRLNP